MISKSTIVNNKTGLHARPASDFVACAKKFNSKISIAKDGAEAVDAKSILNILSQAIYCGTPVIITAEGPDEDQAVNELVTLIDSKFGE